MGVWGIVILALWGSAGFFFGHRQALACSAGHPRNLVSHPFYHGFYLALGILGVGLVFLLGYHLLSSLLQERYILSLLPDSLQQMNPAHQSLTLSRIDDIVAMISYGAAPPSGEQPWLVDAAHASIDFSNDAHAWGMVLLMALSGAAFFFFRRHIQRSFHSQNQVEKSIRVGLMLCAALAVAATFGIVFSMLFEAIAFFKAVPIVDFLFGTVWDPRFQEAGDIIEDGEGVGYFGLIPLLWGTIYISVVAMFVAGPIGLMAAVFLSQYASKRWRAFAKPALELLAGIPTVVYGFFALAFVGPLLHQWGMELGIRIGTTSVLVAGLVMGIMIIPYVSSLSEDILSAIPRGLREGSAALGATMSETIRQVLIPAALPGIVAAFILAFSRAIGETMIVVMAAGIAARLSINPFESLTTITVKIVSQLTGDLEFNTPQTQVAFALGLVLFVVTFCMNIVALRVVRAYRLQYD